MTEKSPDAFRTISEVAEWLGVNAHVLRFWESKFSQVKPIKRAGGRRYYRPADMELLGGIQKLLHEDGMTIKGVQKILRDQGIRAVSALSKPVDAVSSQESEDEAPRVSPAEEPVVSAADDGQASGMDEPEAVAEPEFNEPDPADIVEPEPVDEKRQEPMTEPEMSMSAMDSPGADPVPEPEPDADPEDDPAPVMPLFSHRALGGVDLGSNAPEEPGDGPVIAPLPAADLPLSEAISRLQPLQVSPALLGPIHARLVALRDRMDQAARADS